MEMSLACNEKMWSEEDEGTGTASSSSSSSSSSSVEDDLNFDGLRSVVDRR